MDDLFELENKLHADGYKLVCGTDEAGAGPLAGPVYAAAVILKENAEIPGLDDSKKLTEKKREKLFDIIIENAEAYAIASVDEKTIDEINILQARMLAMRTAVSKLSVKPDFLLVDGNRDPEALSDSMCVVGGDGKCACIAAASVLAKVSRDRFMLEMDKKYPVYGFAKHKGYGTKAHCEAILKYGASEIHRKTFLTKLSGGDK